MRTAILTVLFLSYWALLTVLLLAPHPEQIVHVRPPINFGIHFTAFTILALLAHLPCWPRTSRGVIALLLIYAFLAETLQGLVPPRTVELRDYVENFLGVAVGTGIYWAMLGAVAWIRKGNASEAETSGIAGVPAE